MKQHRPPQPKRHTLYKPKARTVALDSAAWRNLRAQVLGAEPLCRDCHARGIVEPATQVDHQDNNGDNNALSNLVPLCDSCHSRKTAAEDMGKTVRHGCDVNGVPLDPDHPWRKDHEQSAATFRPPIETHIFAENGDPGEWQG